ESKLEALKLAFMRPGLPNLTNVLATLAIFAVVVYLQGMSIKIAVQHKSGQMARDYPIKLFYTSTTPIQLQSMATSYAFLVSQSLSRKMPGNLLVKLIGSWREVESSPGQYVPTSGLIYLLAPPTSMFAAATHPIHTVLYLTWMLGSCGLIAKYYVDMSGTGADKKEEELQAQGLQMKGFTRPGAMKKKLNKYIPRAAVVGGILVGAIQVGADLTGAIGSGTGILLCATTLVNSYEEIARLTKVA
ncbi:SecY/SEC61-alpha family protein, partial [Kipferlia bialata]